MRIQRLGARVNREVPENRYLGEKFFEKIIQEIIELKKIDFSYVRILLRIRRAFQQMFQFRSVEIHHQALSFLLVSGRQIFGESIKSFDDRREQVVDFQSQRGLGGRLRNADSGKKKNL